MDEKLLKKKAGTTSCLGLVRGGQNGQVTGAIHNVLRLPLGLSSTLPKL